MRLRFSRLRWPEWVIGAGGLLLLVSMLLLPWFHVITFSPVRHSSATSDDGWHGLTDGRWLILLTILAAFAAVFFQARERSPALPVVFTQTAWVLACLTFVWLIYRVLINPPGGREIGGWIALASAAAIVFGGYWSCRLEGIAEADAPNVRTVRLTGEGAT